MAITRRYKAYTWGFDMYVHNFRSIVVMGNRPSSARRHAYLNFLIRETSRVSAFPAVQVWYADDAATWESLSSLREWWNELFTVGPSFGYYPNASKS